MSNAFQLSVARAQLLEAIKLAAEAVASRSTLPILTHLRVKAEDGLLKVAATNLEIGIEKEIPAAVQAPGALCVPARTFADFVASLVGETVLMTMTAKNQTVNVRCDRFSANIKGMDADEFPGLYPTTTDHDYVSSVDCGLIAAAIDQVVFAVATDESRPILTGVHVNVDGSQTRFDAADGFRLSVRLLPATQCKPVDVIIPGKAMNLTRKSLGREGTQVKVTITANRDKIVFEQPGLRIISTLIDGHFPNTDQIVPKVTNTRIVVARADLLSTVKAVDVFSDKAKDLGKTVRFTVIKEDNGDYSMVISADSAETGSGLGVLPVSLDRGGAFDVHLQSAYVMDVLRALNTPQVALESEYVSGEKPNPVAIKGVGVTEYTHVIMPIAAKGAVAPVPGAVTAAAAAAAAVTPEATPAAVPTAVPTPVTTPEPVTEGTPMPVAA